MVCVDGDKGVKATGHIGCLGVHEGGIAANIQVHNPPAHSLVNSTGGVGSHTVCPGWQVTELNKAERQINPHLPLL